MRRVHSAPNLTQIVVGFDDKGAQAPSGYGAAQRKTGSVLSVKIQKAKISQNEKNTNSKRGTQQKLKYL
jgi:hypothetical protein